jgi:hypothetical protein
MALALCFRLFNTSISRARSKFRDEGLAIGARTRARRMPTTFVTQVLAQLCAREPPVTQLGEIHGARGIHESLLSCATIINDDCGDNFAGSPGNVTRAPFYSTLPEYWAYLFYITILLFNLHSLRLRLGIMRPF